MLNNMKDSKKITLGEVSVNNRGYYGIGASSVDYDPNKYTYLRITDISDDGVLNKEGLKSVDEINAEDYLLKPNDIVLARTGNSTGRNYFYDGRDGELVYAGFLIKFSIDPNKINPKYVKYYLMTNEYKGWVSSFNTGSTRGNINAQTFSTLEIPLLPPEQQDLIADVLSALDDKIEVNNKINDNLEKQAQAIFKQWFVDFEFPDKEGNPYKTNGGEFIDSELGEIPLGWRIGRLGDIADIIMGQSPAGTSYNEVGEGEIFYQGRTDFGVRFPTIRMYTTEPKRIAEANSILFSVRAPVGDINLTTERCCIGRGLASLKSKDNNNSFLFYLMYSLDRQFRMFNGEGTVFGSINKDSLNGIDIIIPSSELIMKFNEIANAIDSQIKNNFFETRNLSELRDYLLPKLMSGEVRV